MLGVNLRDVKFQRRARWIQFQPPGSFCMSGFQSAAAFNSSVAVRARRVCIALLAWAVAGCATPPQNPRTIDIISRESNDVSHGVVSSYFPRTTKIVIDIDRRIYSGNSEPTASNETFGFVRSYGQGRYTASTTTTLLNNSYFKAILSSSDNHTLRCDLRAEGGLRRDGICLDDFGRVYDVVSSR